MSKTKIRPQKAKSTRFEKEYQKAILSALTPAQRVEIKTKIDRRG